MKKCGKGVASMWYGIGNTGLPNPAGAFVDLLDDGTVQVLTGCADIGQGSSTVLAQIAAEEIGVSIEDVRVVWGDTGFTPDAGASSASRQTYISGNAVRQAAAAAKTVLYEMAAETLKVSPEELEIVDKIFRIKKNSGESREMVDCRSVCQNDLGMNKGEDQNTVSLADCLAKCRMQGKLTLGHGWFNPTIIPLDPATGQGSPYATYAYATQMVEVEVDTGTGEVNVTKIIAAHDVGTAINPCNVEAQIEGGCVIGLGYALMEEIKADKGRILNTNLATYTIPTALDVPEIVPLIVEEPESTGPFGAKGVGEPALIPTAAAIANAVYDAVGIRVTELPITPEKLLVELKAKGY